MANFTHPYEWCKSGLLFFVKNLISALKHWLNKPISPFFKEVHMVKRVDKYRHSRQWCRNIWNVWKYRHINFFWHNILGYADYFLLLKSANSLLALLAGGLCTIELTIKKFYNWTESVSFRVLESKVLT